MKVVISKLRVRLVVGFCLMLSAASSRAATEILAGVNYRSFDYKEDLRAPLKSTEKADFFAPFVQVRLPIPSLAQSFVQLSGEMSGNVNSHFDGTTQSGVPVKDSNTLSFADFDALFFWNFAPQFFLQGGIGYHYWNRYLSGGAGYREIYTWFYMPIGILYQHQVSNNFSVSVDLTYRLTFQGEIKVIFSETVSSGDDTTLTLGDRPGYRLSVPLRYAFEGTNFGMTVAPWYEFSEIGASEFKFNSTPTSSGPLGYIQEPASKTNQTGLQLGMIAWF